MSNTLQDKMLKLVEDLHEKAKKQAEEIKQWNVAYPETKKAIDEINNRIDQVEVMMQRPVVAQLTDRNERKSSPARQAFVQAFRHGWKNISEVEQKLVKRVSATDEDYPELKALSLSDDTTGGYLAESEFVRDILKTVTEFSPLRAFANVRTTVNREVRMPIRTAQFAAKWTAEVGTRTETTGLTYGLKTIPADEMYADVRIHLQDIEDAAFDLEAQVIQEAAEQFAVLEGAAFISGDAIGKPEGILTNTNVSQNVTEDANLVTATGLNNIFYGIKDAYARNAVWMMRRATIKAVRLLVGADGQFLWQPGLNSSTPPTLLGQPVLEAIDMPAIAANAFPIIFGDMKRAYTIVDRINFVVQRLVERYAELAQIGILVRRRVGGKVVMSEAVRKLKISA